VVRGEVLAIAPTPASLAIAAKAGFTVIRETRLASLDLDLVSMSPPKGVSAREGLSRLRALDPSGQYDLDHIYTGAGEAGGGANPPAPPEGAATPAPGARVGLLDTGIDRDHPAFRASSVEQKGFAPGGVRPGAHGTAVASLMIGKARRFRGAAPGAALLVGDVYGDGPTGGSAYAIAGGLAWMAERKMPVVNISLVGPPNLTLEAAVRAAVARGILIVAPVGNDGPAAPPLYPAAYPGVIAVTGVDARGKVLIEAGRAGHIDFRAPGADITAADGGGGYEDVRGTSFASPIVAGALALRLLRPDRAAAARAVADLSTQAARDGGVVGADLIAADRWPR
jgi:subtilisin family serine protease